MENKRIHICFSVRLVIQELRIFSTKWNRVSKISKKYFMERFESSCVYCEWKVDDLINLKKLLVMPHSKKG